MYSRNDYEFVLYFLIEEGCSEFWLETVARPYAINQLAKIVFVGGVEVLDRVGSYSDTGYLSCNLSSHASRYYRKILDYHEEQGFEYDLLLVRSDVYIPRISADLFTCVLARNPNLGTVSPVTNQGKLFSVCDETQSDISFSTINKFLQRVDAPLLAETAFYYPGFVFWKFRALQETLTRVGPEDDETKIAICASEAGLLHVLSASVYSSCNTKQHEKILKKIDNHALSASILAHHPLTGLRHKMADLLKRSQVDQSLDLEQSGPTQLHVMHSWGGGLHRWVSDYSKADLPGKNYALKSIGDWGAFGKRLSLYKHPDDEHAIRHWDLYFPIHGTALAHLQYADIIQSIIHDYGIDIILVSSLIGHSLDILNTTTKTSVILHDYYPFCPAIYIYFKGICTSCNKAKLSECDSRNPLNFLFKGISEEHWMSVRKRYVTLIEKNEIVMIAPSESVKRHYECLVPEFANIEFNVIPHGLANHLSKVDVIQPVRKKRLRIVVLGKLDAQKGLDLLQEIAAELASFADLYFLGCGEHGNKFNKLDGVTTEPYYQFDDLSARLKHYSPDLGLLLPIWPETFSYTLSELAVHGIPVAVSRHGAPLDRVEHGKSGFLVNPEPDEIIRQLRELAEEPAQLDKVRNYLLAQKFRSADTMVKEYHSLLIRSKKDLLNSNVMMTYTSEKSVAVEPIEGPATMLGEGDFFQVMHQLQIHLTGLVNKVPGIHPYMRVVFTLGIKLWLFFPVRFASWYLGRKN